MSDPKRTLPIHIAVTLEEGMVICKPDPTFVSPHDTVVWDLGPGLGNVSAVFEDRPFVERHPFPKGAIATVMGNPPLKKGEKFKTHFRNNDNGEDMKTRGDIIIGG